MPVENIDFEGGAVQQPTATNHNGTPTVEEEPTALNGNVEVEDVTGKDGNNNGGNETQVEETEKADNPSTGELEVGTEIEYDGSTYTVAENGDIVDKDGKVFKEAKDVKAWLDSNESVDDDVLSLDAIQAAIGINVTDEQGNPVDFTNDAAGVKSYVDSVINLKANEIQQGAINSLFVANPMLRQFIDYVQLNGGDPRGFGEIPDRSGIQLDKGNEAQLEAVIRMAAREFGNMSLNDSYINYLKSNNGLYDEAVTQLQALVDKDKAYQREIAERAEYARREEQRQVTEYWNNVSNAITNRVIMGYKLPESFVKEVNGQKFTLTPNDFYNYLAKPAVIDEEGNSMTGYQRDLNNLSDDEILNRELLDAWLMFTGGSYKDLVSMAVEENKVRKLVIKSKEQKATRTVKINKPKKEKVNLDDIVF